MAIKFYIVVASYRDKEFQMSDTWTAHHSIANAETIYKKHLDDGAYSVSICKPIRSTDY